MKIITYDRFRLGVTLETIQPYLPQEVANVWRLWKAGIVRENYARAGFQLVEELHGKAPLGFRESTGPASNGVSFRDFEEPAR
jgi:hypothetical protein